MYNYGLQKRVLRFGIKTSRKWLVRFMGDIQKITLYCSLIKRRVSHRSIFWALFVLGFKAKTSKSGKRGLVSPALHRKIDCTLGNLAWNIKTQKNVLPFEDLGPCKKTFFGPTKSMKLWQNWKISWKCVSPSSTKVRHFKNL